MAKMREEVRLPTVSIDYVFMHASHERDDERGLPILVAKDDETKVIWVHVVPAKGREPYAIERLRTDL